MLCRLESRAKTVPSNYDTQGMTLDLGEPAGFSITPEVLEKAKRMESEYYDWKGYEAIASPSVEHPEYRSRGQAAALAVHWEEVLRAADRNKRSGDDLGGNRNDSEG